MPAAEATRPEHVFKVLVTGPPRAGTTSLIRSVSQTPVVRTDVDRTSPGRDAGRTTVAMDFGTYAISGDGFDADDQGTRLLLFGTPGDPRRTFMTDVVTPGVDAVVFVVDALADDTHREAGRAMRSLLRVLRVPLVVAVNRCADVHRAGSIARTLGALVNDPAVPCTATDPESAREVVVEALIAVLDRLEQWGRPVPCPIDRTRRRLADAS